MAKKPIPNELSALTPKNFRYSEDTGKIRAGFKLVRDTEQFKNEHHESYQFDTFEEVIDAATKMLALSGMKSLKLVTHSGCYKNMKTVFHWTAPETKVVEA